MTQETIAWYPADADSMPDADITVLLHIENAVGEPVWPGYFDGERWFLADGMPVSGRVIEWAGMPAGSAPGDRDAAT